MAGRALSRGLRSASRLVPLVAAGGDGHARRAALDEVDRFILDRLARLVDRVARAYDEYQFHTVFHALHNFCAVDLSALYLDIIKDRLYTSAPDDPRRRAAQTASYDVLSALLRLL